MDAPNVTPLFAKDRAIEWAKQNPNIASIVAAFVFVVIAALAMIFTRREDKKGSTVIKKIVRIERQPIIVREGKKMSRRDPRDDTRDDKQKEKSQKEEAKKEETKTDKVEESK